MYFHRDSDALRWYALSTRRYDQATQQFVTPENPEVTTPEGIGLASPTAELFEAYGPLQRWDCDYSSFERTVSPADEGDEGTLITALDGYYFTVEGGVVTDISHAEGDERDFCY